MFDFNSFKRSSSSRIVRWVEVHDPNHTYKYPADGLVDRGKGDDKIRVDVLTLSAAVASLAVQMVEANKRDELIPAPNWCVFELGSTDLCGIISDPNFTDEGWRTLAVFTAFAGFGERQEVIILPGAFGTDPVM